MRLQVPKLLTDVSGLLLLTVVASFYVFPVGFHGLPESLNSKQLLGVLGVVLFGLQSISERSFAVPRKIIVSFLLACVFSLWCYFCCVFNNTTDYAYATYVRSFFIWMGGAFAVVTIIRFVHGDVNLELVSRYFVLACLAQCLFAILVDNNPGFMQFVDTHFYQDTTPKRVDRLYGIGCSLDSGGVRLCMAEVLIAHQLCRGKLAENRKGLQSFYIISLMIIAVVGNMIARTTTLGLVMALLYVLISYGWAHRGILTARQLRFWRVFLLLIGVTVGIGIYLYSTNPDLRKDFRFAFEAIFNIVEKGEFSTSSSDILMSRMWIWPRDDYAWFVGYGLFEWVHFAARGMQTDIGYCRFTLYCGLIGLALFSFYFIYNATIVRRKFSRSGLLAVILIALTFFIWVKVSTDIFQLYALLFCLPDELDGDDEDIPVSEE